MKKKTSVPATGDMMVKRQAHVRQIGGGVLLAILLLAMTLPSAPGVYGQSAASHSRRPGLPMGGSATTAPNTPPSPFTPTVTKTQVTAKPKPSTRSHTGANTATPGSLLWSYTASDCGPVSPTSPVIANGLVFISGSGYVCALNAATGSLTWSYQTGGSINASPVVVGGVVYVDANFSSGTNVGVYALDAASGVLLWSALQPYGVESSPTVANGMVYVDTVFGAGFVYAFSAASGALVWSYQIGGSSVSPTVVDDVVYATGDYTYALDAATGAFIWKRAGGSGSSPIVVDGVFYEVSIDINLQRYFVNALNAATGALVWTRAVSNQSFGGLTVANGTVYAGWADDNVYAFSATTGARLWSYFTSGTVTTPVVANNVVYASSLGHNIYALDAASGSLLWRFQTSNTPDPPTVSNGAVYAGVYQSAVVAINGTTGAGLWTYSALIGATPIVVGNVVYAVSYTNKTLYALAASPPIQPPAQAPTSTERQGGANPSELNCYQTCAGDPVDTYSGNFDDTFDALNIPGRGIWLNFSLTYNAGAAAQNGPLGYGWTDSYDWSLATDGSGNVTITQENGSTVSFAPNGSGGYTPPSRVLAALVKNGDGTYTFTRQQTQDRYTFNASGQLTQEIDRNSYITSLSYNGSGQLTTVTDPAGRTLTLAYNGSGLITTVTDPGNRTVSFSYDGGGNLQSYTDVAGGVTSFTYDSSHRLLAMTDPRGGGVTNVYDGSGRVTSQTDALNRVTTFSYTGPDGNGNSTTTITDPKGNVTVDQYYNGLLLAETRGYGTAQAATTSYTYDPVSLGVASITDPNGYITSQIWDAHGNLLSTTDPLGRTTSSTYDAQNDLLTATDANGVTTSYTYDAYGNLLTMATPLLGTSQTRTTSYTYGDASHPGDLTAMTDPNSKTWMYSYDAYGDRATATDPLGDVTSDTYNVLSQRTAQISPNGNVTGANPAAYTTHYTYNLFGDLLSQTDPLGHMTQYQYDADRNQTLITDAGGHTTSSSYDLDNELTTITRADSTTLNYSYDNDGNQTGQTDGLGHTTTYAYDPLNRLVALSDPLNRVTTYAYDAASNRISQTAPGNLTTNYSYDTADELVGITYSDGSTPSVTYTYDGDGRRATMSDGTGTTSYSYDSLRRLTSSNDGAGNSVGYSYDLAGNLTSLLYPNGKTVTRAYDAAGRMTSVSDWLGHTTAFRYDADANLTTIAYPNGVRGTRSYDAANQLTGIADRYAGATILQAPQLLFAETYTRDATGQLLSTTALAPTQSATTNSYTPLLQLQSAGSTAYAYDKADEPTQLGAASLTEDAAGEVTQVAAGAITDTFSYDARGNRTQMAVSSGATVNYSYDAANRLTSVAGIVSGTTTYAYNGDGLRMSKKVGSSAAEGFVWDTAEGLPLLLVDGTTSFVSGPGGMPLEQITGSGSGAQALYLLTDQLGSVRALADSSGKLQATYTYDAYGATTATTGTASTLLRFAGQFLDAETGQYYLRARYYDPATAQFLTRDPLVPLTKQPYVYANDNPLNAVDVTGLNWFSTALDIVGIAAASVGAVALVAGAVSTAPIWGTIAFGATAVGIGASILGTAYTWREASQGRATSQEAATSGLFTIMSLAPYFIPGIGEVWGEYMSLGALGAQFGIDLISGSSDSSQTSCNSGGGGGW